MVHKGYSQYLSCKVVGLSRSAYRRRKVLRAQRLQTPKDRPHALLIEWMVSFANEHRRWGYRRALVQARAAGFTVGRDTFRRLWRQENLRVFPRKRKKKKLDRQPMPRNAPASAPGQVWAVDFQFDSDFNGRQFKVCNVIDEFTRQHIAFSVDRSIKAIDVIELLDIAVLTHGGPQVLRMDSGPEFISENLKSWSEEQELVQAFIPAGQPWHNGFVESLHNRMLDEVFEDNVFFSLEDVKQRIEWWSFRCNKEHPHSALGYQTPNAFAEQWNKNKQLATA
ncbi:IS3 family transposase [Arcanobacterium phocae]|uniref:IS3 family transposase n=1 Tax=Arcanobacterium phocae TaxID=131112 RepID=UPI001C1125D6|nr:IS3 family transposase [Arcanobacterium phocae]